MVSPHGVGGRAAGAGLSRRGFLIRAGALPLGLLPVAGAEPATPEPGKWLVAGEPPLPAADSFTFAVLPDTQIYSERFPETFEAQTRWVVANRERRRIAAVFHLGDITNRNTAPQWENARRAIRVLVEAAMPCCLCAGNHDYGAGGNGADRSSLMADHFPVKELSKAPHWAGNYDREPERPENSAHLIDAGGRRFVVLCLEFGPRDDVLRWANEVVARHAGREAILLTHAFIYHDDTRYDWQRHGPKQQWNPHAYGMAKHAGGVNDGEEIWRKLVARHESFTMVLNGHVLVDGLGRFSSRTPGGRAVPQMLVNFQMLPNGGNGWLRLIEMRRDGSMQVCDYSPTLGQSNHSPQNRFTVPW